MLINLISNAIKFTSEGSVNVTIQERGREAEHITYQISIKDTGIGIAPDAIGSLTEAFTKADTSITRSFGGTGLGLAISSNILSLFNTQLEIDSTPGEGAVFYFTVSLPLAAETEGVPVNATEGNTGLCNSEQIRFLIVDDSEINQLVIENLLASVDQHEVHCVEHGEAALTLLQQQNFDVIFMDMQMPVMDGISATKAIRSTPRLQGQYIIGLSANVMHEDRQKCMDAGMNDFLGKPLLREHLIEALNRYLTINGNELPAIHYS